MAPGVAAVVMAAAVALAQTAGPDRGPSQGPVTVTPVKTTRRVSAAAFLKAREIIGNVAQQVTSVHAVELEDARPYGEVAQRTVELARFESVPVRSPNGWESVSIPLSLAFDADTGAFVCAFTDAKDEWVRSPLDSGAIEKRVADAGWKTAPCHGPLASTLVDVIEAAWKRFGVDPGKAGQVVIRPRFVTNAYPADEVGGKMVPRIPPADVWIVEILGVVVMERDDEYGHRSLTTLVAQFRDGDLESLPSMMLP